MAAGYSDLARELLECVGYITHAQHEFGTGSGSANAAKGEAGTLLLLANGDHPLSPGNISRLLNVTPARTANVLKALEAKGFITRNTNTHDRRKVEVLITPKGRKAAEDQYNESVGVMELFLDLLSEDDAKELTRLMGKLKDAVIANTNVNQVPFGFFES